MGLTPGTAIDSLPIDRVFIGSCTNARIEDLRAAASVAKDTGSTAACARWSCRDRRRSRPMPSAKASIASSPTAGFEWREPGCSMCLGMNDDILGEGERCAVDEQSAISKAARAAAAARTWSAPRWPRPAAIEGRFTDVREWEYR
jgi:3-isopropylmalate/(R)-2-methylmalate dehydratase large subunit